MHRHPDPFRVAEEIAGEYDGHLRDCITQALALEREGLSLESALITVGNDVAVFHTYPLALFLIARFGEDEALLPVAAHVGGNTDTIGFICGSWRGASEGTAAFAGDLVMQLEGQDHIQETAEQLFELSSGKD